MKELSSHNETPQQTNTSLEVWQQDRLEVTSTRYIERLTFRKMLATVASSFNFEKGLLSTMKGLTIHPHKTIRAYLNTGRFDVISPVKYFLLIYGLTIFIGSINGFYIVDTSELESGFNIVPIEKSEIITNEDGTSSTVTTKSHRISLNENLQLMSFVNDMMMKYSNLLGLLGILIISTFSLLFFRSSNYNFTEHLVINTYISAHATIIVLLCVTFQTQNVFLLMLSSLISFIMSCIVFYKLFHNSKFKTLYKTVLIHVLSGLISVFLMCIAIAIYIQKSGLFEEIVAKMDK